VKEYFCPEDGDSISPRKVSYLFAMVHDIIAQKTTLCPEDGGSIFLRRYLSEYPLSYTARNNTSTMKIEAICSSEALQPHAVS
jgi:hypothetical protein